MVLYQQPILAVYMSALRRNALFDGLGSSPWADRQGGRVSDAMFYAVWIVFAKKRGAIRVSESCDPP